MRRVTNMLGLIQPLDGLQNSAAQFNQAASNIARATLPISKRPGFGGFEHRRCFLAQARNSFDANTKVFKTVDEMDKTLINAIG